MPQNQKAPARSPHTKLLQVDGQYLLRKICCDARNPHPSPRIFKLKKPQGYNPWLELHGDFEIS